MLIYTLIFLSLYYVFWFAFFRISVLFFTLGKFSRHVCWPSLSGSVRLSLSLRPATASRNHQKCDWTTESRTSSTDDTMLQTPMMLLPVVSCCWCCCLCQPATCCLESSRQLLFREIVCLLTFMDTFSTAPNCTRTVLQRWALKYSWKKKRKSENISISCWQNAARRKY